MPQTLTVGVLGGMGPEATLDFFAKLLAATPAGSDQARPRVVIDNNPKVPNRNEAVAGTGPSPGPALARMARGLESLAADFLVMPCNAAHAFAGDIASAVSIPFVSIIEETAAAVLQAHPEVSRVGVLAAAGCLDADLYGRAFSRRGVDALGPSGVSRERFMALLYRIKQGDVEEGARAEMRELAHDLISRGAQVLVAGCTEVPLVLNAGDVSVPLVNSTDALVEATRRYALGESPLPVASEGR